MKNQSLLTFTLHGQTMAIDTKVVREIIWLPELTLLEECPDYMAGVINLHGKILPVLDLNQCFNHPPRRYSCSDRVIILDVAEAGVSLPASQASMGMLGIIVNDVLDVLDIPGEDIELPPLAGCETRPHFRFISGEAKSGDGIIMVLDSRKILAGEFGTEDGEIAIPETPPPSAISYFCPEADQSEKEIFHNRAGALRQVFDQDDVAGRLGVAVVMLNGECLCLELESVREFAKIHNITPVPCCPEHIVGNMNLRGNVLTVVDIRGLLNMGIGKIPENSKVVVADGQNFSAGIVVDEILDVITIRESDIVEVPATIKALNEKFVKGAAPFGSKMMALLDIRKILAWDGLVVNEEV
jgi:purine-binding chemotaxis protein CheW